MSRAFLLVALLVAACGSASPAQEGVFLSPVSEPVVEPTPYVVDPEPWDEDVTSFRASPVVVPKAGEQSLPWALYRIWDRGRRVAVEVQGPGCGTLHFEESADSVLVQVVGRSTGACRWLAFSLEKPLGDRRLLHSPTSLPADASDARTLAQRFDDTPPWPGHPWYRDGKEVLRMELSLADGPEHCNWEQAVFVSGKGLGDKLWVRDTRGVLDHFPRAKQELQVHATLPPQATSTGYSSGSVEIWREGDALYLVNSTDRSDVERWVVYDAGLCL